MTDPVTALAFLRGQARGMVDRGFDVHLACGVSADLRQFAHQEGITIHNVPLSRTWWSHTDMGSLWRAVTVLRRLKPDVLSYSTPKAAAIWAIASWFKRPSKVVFLLRGLRLEGQRTWSLGFLLLWLMEFVAARTADLTLCVSPSLRERALRLRLVSADRAHVLLSGSSNGVDTTRFKPVTDADREAARRRMGIDEEAFVVGYVGRLARDKGLGELLDAASAAASSIPKLRLVTIGSSEPSFDMMRELQDLPRAASITKVFPASSCIERDYAAFDVFALPSYREGLSNALLEAQARGLPCITTDATGCRDAIEPGVTGLVISVRDADALARAIGHLHANPAVAADMGRAGRQRVAKYFDQEQLWDAYADCFARDLGDPGRWHDRKGVIA